MSQRIIKNAARCTKCGETIESRHGHDFRRCSCGAIAVDGGKNYIRRMYESPADIEELSEFSGEEEP